MAHVGLSVVGQMRRNMKHSDSIASKGSSKKRKKVVSGKNPQKQRPATPDTLPIPHPSLEPSGDSLVGMRFLKKDASNIQAKLSQGSNKTPELKKKSTPKKEPPTTPKAKPTTTEEKNSPAPKKATPKDTKKNTPAKKPSDKKEVPKSPKAPKKESAKKDPPAKKESAKKESAKKGSDKKEVPKSPKAPKKESAKKDTPAKKGSDKKVVNSPKVSAKKAEKKVVKEEPSSPVAKKVGAKKAVSKDKRKKDDESDKTLATIATEVKATGGSKKKVKVEEAISPAKKQQTPVKTKEKRSSEDSGASKKRLKLVTSDPIEEAAKGLVCYFI